MFLRCRNPAVSSILPGSVDAFALKFQFEVLVKMFERCTQSSLLPRRRRIPPKSRRSSMGCKWNDGCCWPCGILALWKCRRVWWRRWTCIWRWTDSKAIASLAAGLDVCLFRRPSVDGHSSGCWRLARSSGSGSPVGWFRFCVRWKLCACISATEGWTVFRNRQQMMELNSCDWRWPLRAIVEVGRSCWWAMMTMM